MTPAVFPTMTQPELLRFAEQFHQIVRSCYVSKHAQFCVSNSAQERESWDLRSKWARRHNCPPVRWHDPSVIQRSDGSIVIHTSRNTEIFVSESDAAKIVSAALTEAA